MAISQAGSEIPRADVGSGASCFESSERADTSTCGEPAPARLAELAPFLGEITQRSGPGIGYEVKPELMERLTIRKQVFSA